MAEAGALLVDVGGESTRPGAEFVPAAEEQERILPVIESLVREGTVAVSVDTRKPEVARAALEAGAHLVNDVTGLRDPALRAVCAEYGAPAVVMHMQGEPGTMQRDPTYEDVAAEVFGFLREQATRALAEGVPGVLLDPGIGFGKTREHNLTLLRALPALCAGEYPVLVGASRKRLIDYLAGVPDARDRDPGSIAIHLHAATTGASMVRVHDVPGHVQALRVWEAVRGK
jgi:dihydropteroate synthase